MSVAYGITVHIHFLVFTSLACLMLVHSIGEDLYICVHREFEIPQLNIEHCLQQIVYDMSGHPVDDILRGFFRGCEIVGSSPGTREWLLKV